MLDDKQRIALVETETVVDGDDVTGPVPLQRHQLGNHLGSASVELAADGALISYEEYHPYGTTAFRAGRSAAETSLKRYRYIGKERDEETGLALHGARYYASWLGRWVSADPARLKGGLNLFAYASANPIRLVDPTGFADEDAQPRPTNEFEVQAKFDKIVAKNLRPDEPSPSTAKEKSNYVDIDSPEHDQAVVNIVNAAIDAAAEKARLRGDVLSEYELLRSALHGFTSTYRNSNKVTQNLVLRDVDHYLTGRIQEWRKEYTFVMGAGEWGGPQFTKSAATIKEESYWPPSPGPPLITPLIVLGGQGAANYYEADKLESFQKNPDRDAPNAKSSQDLSSLPGSAPGSLFWSFLGGMHLRARDDPREKADPAKLKITLEDVQQARRNLKAEARMREIESAALGF